MAWSTAVTDCRLKLNDNANDKIRAFKRVLGQIDGVNTRFKTFEFRRVSNFTTSSDPIGVYLNQALLATSAIQSDNLETGFFTLVTAPQAGDVLEATYYIQFFLDAELQVFLRLASNWLGFSDDYTGIPGGLQPAAIQYVSAEAYQKLASRFSEHLSETYRLEDMPDVTRQALIQEYKNASTDAREMAHKLRDEYYKRQGQSLSPRFAIGRGFVTNVAPNR